MLALLQVAVAGGVGGVSGQADVGVEPVEGLFGSPLAEGWRWSWNAVATVQIVGEVGIAVGEAWIWDGSVARVGDGVTVGPVVRVEFAGLGGPLLAGGGAGARLLGATAGR